MTWTGRQSGSYYRIHLAHNVGDVLMGEASRTCLSHHFSLRELATFPHSVQLWCSAPHDSSIALRKPLGSHKKKWSLAAEYVMHISAKLSSSQLKQFILNIIQTRVQIIFFNVRPIGCLICVRDGKVRGRYCGFNIFNKCLHARACTRTVCKAAKHWFSAQINLQIVQNTLSDSDSALILRAHAHTHTIGRVCRCVSRSASNTGYSHASVLTRSFPHSLMKWETETFEPSSSWNAWQLTWV